MTFYTYMMRNHSGQDTPAGDLADDMKWDKENFPRNGVGKFDGWHSLIRRYLEREGACYDCLRVFEECWRDYELTERRRLKMKCEVGA